MDLYLLLQGPDRLSQEPDRLSQGPESPARLPQGPDSPLATSAESQEVESEPIPHLPLVEMPVTKVGTFRCLVILVKRPHTHLGIL